MAIGDFADRALIQDTSLLITLITCPPQFHYEPYTATKRITTTMTANALILQSSSPQYVAGDDMMRWSIEAAFPSEYQAFTDIYHTDDPVLYIFTGYWGDEYQVYFEHLSPPSIQGRSFNFGGTFRIMEIISLPSNLTI